MPDLRPTPTATAGACGLRIKVPHSSAAYLTWDMVLAAACDAYWDRRPDIPRPDKTRAAA